MKYLLLILILPVFTGCSNQADKTGNQSNKNTGSAAFVFQEEFHNFGSLQAGEIVAYSFRIKNTGTGKLKILNAKVDCGCITVEYPKKEIIQGDSAYVDVIFSSAGETGNVYKEILIITNAGNKKNAKLAIAAHVKNESINIYSAN
ncbi:MAG: DUF1573 domain-containing protein [Bacteroidales bacterium]|jgi:hypothetical protein